jgi:hypothetical protein
MFRFHGCTKKILQFTVTWAYSRKRRHFFAFSRNSCFYIVHSDVRISPILVGLCYISMAKMFTRTYYSVTLFLQCLFSFCCWLSVDNNWFWKFKHFLWKLYCSVTQTRTPMHTHARARALSLSLSRKYIRIMFVSDLNSVSYTCAWDL